MAPAQFGLSNCGHLFSRNDVWSFFSNPAFSGRVFSNPNFSGAWAPRIEIASDVTVDSTVTSKAIYMQGTNFFPQTPEKNGLCPQLYTMGPTSLCICGRSCTSSACRFYTILHNSTNGKNKIRMKLPVTLLAT